MRRRGLVILLAMLSVFVILPLASAEISVGDVDSVYNLGDELNLPVTVSSGTDVSGFLTADLVCTGLYNFTTNQTVEKTVEVNSSENNETNTTTINVQEISSEFRIDTRFVEIYKSTLSVNGKEGREVVLSVKFDKSLIGELNGRCVIRSVYNAVSADSGEFQLTRDLDVEMDLSGVQFYPEDSLNVVGHAYKKRGDALNGFVEVSIPLLNQSVFGVVKDGLFNFSFKIPRDAHAGEYRIIAGAYERDADNQKKTYGEAYGAFKVKQITDKVEIAFNSKSIVPGNDIVFNVLLKDQAGDEVKGDVAVLLYYPNNTIIEKRLIKSGRAESLTIKPADVPGYWKVEAGAGDLKSAGTFFVEELQQAEFSLANGTMTIRNTGNVNYAKPVEVSIGDKKEIINVNISVGGVKKFKLTAPDGNYAITANDGISVNSFGTSFLTGRAIGISDLSLGSSLPLNIILWALIILVLIAIAIYAYRRIARGSYSGRMPGFFHREESAPMMYTNIQMPTQAPARPVQSIPAQEDDEIMPNYGFKEEEQRVRQRVQSLSPAIPFWRRDRNEKDEAKPSATMEQANRQESSVVCLNIKNIADIEGSKGGAMGAIDRALSKAKSMRAKVYVDNDYRVIIFTPELTREQNNEMRAVNAAKQIEEILIEYNKVHVQKIQFGIGINSGELIGEASGGGFKFTSVGNTISAAKKISDSAFSEVLLSESFHRKTAGAVKVEAARGFWKIRRIVNREKNSEFIERFVAGQKKTGRRQ